MIGKIKWYNARKKYGFIEGEDGNSYFIHESNIVEGRSYVGLDPDDAVVFTIGNGRNGKQAENVSLYDQGMPISEGVQEGKVKWYDMRKRYGFIESNDDNHSYFVHVSCINDGRSYIGLEKGDSVEFDATQGNKGLQAVNCRFIPDTDE